MPSRCKLSRCSEYDFSERVIDVDKFFELMHFIWPVNVRAEFQMRIMSFLSVFCVAILPVDLTKVEALLQPKTIDLPSNFDSIFSQNNFINFLLAVGIESRL